MPRLCGNSCPVRNMSLIILPLFIALSTFSTSSAQAGIIVFVTAIIAAYIISMVRPWLSIILIIVYIGGMLVVLSYLMAISPKKTEPRKLSLSILASIPIFIVLSNPYFERLNSSVMQIRDIYSKESL